MSVKLYGFLTDLIAGKGELVSSLGDLVAIGDVLPNSDIVLFAPGADVSVLSAVLPARSEVEIKRAAPYAVEDELAVPVEDLHFAFGAASSDKQSPRLLHAVAMDKMQAWSNWLMAEPVLHRAQLVAEQSVFDFEKVYKVEEYYVGSTGGRAFVLDTSLPEDMLQAFLNEGYVETVTRHDYLQILIERADVTEGLINLRQGQFRAGSVDGSSGFRQWRLSAGLAAVLAIALCVQTLLDTSSLRADHDEVTASIETTFRNTFPEASTPTNYVRAVARQVNGQSNSLQITFREASAALYIALRDVPDAQLLSLRYAQEDGELIAKIAYSAYGNDATLKAALTEQGFVADLGDARQERAGVVGDIIIRKGAI